MVLTKEYLSSLDEKTRADVIVKEYFKCALDIKYCIETYFTVNAV